MLLVGQGPWRLGGQDSQALWEGTQPFERQRVPWETVCKGGLSGLLMGSLA